MTIVICPGYHPPELTIDFLKGIGRLPNSRFHAEDIIYPAHCQPPYSGLHVLTFIRQQLSVMQGIGEYKKTHFPALLFIGFSAGVVAAIGAAKAWQAGGGSVKAMIAIDGWGVPLWDRFPIHRMSHDAFTHWSSGLLGGDDGFYAEPSVGHLDLWRSPQQIRGYYIKSLTQNPVSSQHFSDRYHRTTAADLLNCWLKHYRESEIT